MALEPQPDLPRLQAATRLPQPVPAIIPRGKGPRTSRLKGNRIGLAALGVFAAGLASVVAFKGHLNPTVVAPAATASAFKARPAAQFSAPVSRLRHRAEPGAAKSSPQPFYGAGVPVAAVGSDADEAAVSARPGSGGGDDYQLVPYEGPQPEAAQAAARPLAPFRKVPYLLDIASAKGANANGLRLSGVENPNVVMLRYGRPEAQTNPALMQPCPDCDRLSGLESRPDKWRQPSGRGGVLSFVGVCKGEYVYKMSNTPGMPTDLHLVSQSGESWDVNTSQGGSALIKSKEPLGNSNGVEWRKR